MGIRLALDWGDARIGVAACDRDGLLAYPLTTVRAGATELVDIRAVVAEYEPIEVLVGLPRSLAGGEGPAATKMRERAGRLAAAIQPVPVRLVDERLTTVTASSRLRAGGTKARDQRKLIDAAAAVVILEQSLALERGRKMPPGELVSASGGPV